MYAIGFKGEDSPIFVCEYFDEAVNEMRELYNIYLQSGMCNLAHRLQVINLGTGKVVY